MNNTYAYQKEFVDRAIDLLDSKGKAAVVLPTGVGKSQQHGDVDIYSAKNGVHLESADKITGRTIKPAVKGEIK